MIEIKGNKMRECEVSGVWMIKINCKVHRDLGYYQFSQESLFEEEI